MTNLTYQIGDTLTPAQIARIKTASNLNHLTKAFQQVGDAFRHVGAQVTASMKSIATATAAVLGSSALIAAIIASFVRQKPARKWAGQLHPISLAYAANNLGPFHTKDTQ